MNIWSNGVITNKGLALQAKLIEGTCLEITRAVTATGYVTPGLLQSETNVTGERQTLNFKTVTYPEYGKCHLPCYLTNDNLTTGYTAMQIGIFANDPDEGEILYFICQSEIGKGTVIPSKTEMPGYNAEWNIYLQYGMADAVVVEVDPSDASLHLTLENKADRDLLNVTKVHFLERAVVSGAAIPIVHTTGTGEAYEVDIPGLDVLHIGSSIIMVPHVTSTTTMPTLTVKGFGTYNLRQQLSTNFAATTAGAIPTWVSAGRPAFATFDGELWKVDITRPSASNLYGEVPIEKGGTGASTPEEARENLDTPSNSSLEAVKAEVQGIKDSVVNDIVGNYHAITFGTLDGLVVTGVWNATKERLEC